MIVDLLELAVGSGYEFQGRADPCFRIERLRGLLPLSEDLQHPRVAELWLAGAGSASHNGLDAGWMFQCCIDCSGGTHGHSGQHSTFEIKGIKDCHDIVAVPECSAIWSCSPSVTARIESDQSSVFESLQLRRPHSVVKRSAVEEYHGLLRLSAESWSLNVGDLCAFELYVLW